MLPENDTEFLQEKGYDYEVVNHPGGLYVLIKEFELSGAYVPDKATILINIPTGYPDTPLDMFWTVPDVKLTSGSWPEAAEHHEEHHGMSRQRWSRHIAWRSGIDTLRTFISAIKNEIAKGK